MWKDLVQASVGASRGRNLKYHVTIGSRDTPTRVLGFVDSQPRLQEGKVRQTIVKGEGTNAMSGFSLPSC